MAERSQRFIIGLILAIVGYSAMIFTAAANASSTIIVWTAQIGVIIFVLGVIIMLISA